MRLVWIGAFVIALPAIASAAPCPAGAALLDIAREAFPPSSRNPTGTSGDEIAIEPAHVACQLVRAHGTHWLLTMDTRTSFGLLVALVTAKHVDWNCCGLSPGTPNMAIDKVRVADLDSDGIDELLVTVSYEGHSRSHSERLLVHEPMSALHPYGPQDDSRIELARRGPQDESDCRSTWRLVPGPHNTRSVEVTGKCTGGAPGDYPTGRHVYALRGSEIVELISAP